MKLMHIALISSLAGLILLGILSQNLEPKLTKISWINSKMIDNYVKINAYIENMREINNLTILTVNDESSEITAIITDFRGNISIKDRVEIIGRVTEYKKEPEIEVEKIKII